jgi:hypothetical protein
MKYHLQKTRTENGRIVKYNLPECNKRGNRNLAITNLDGFKSLSIENKSLCCVDCLAKIN